MLLLGHIISMYLPTMRFSIVHFCRKIIFFMLFCSTLVPLKMLLSINTKVEFVNKDSTEGQSTALEFS